MRHFRTAIKLTAAKQKGATLMMTLIMLVLLMLFVVSAINWSSINMRIVGNMQAQNEARIAAEMAINQMMSAPISTVAPPAILVDINNDGTNDYSVAIAAPPCVGHSLSKDTGAESPNIYDSVLEVQATVTSLSIFGSGVGVTLTQGVSVFAGGACS